MSGGYEAEVLARQLSQLGRDLQDGVAHLGELEEQAVDCEGDYRHLEAEYDDGIDRAFLIAEGSVEARRAQSRIKCHPARLIMLDASLEWGRAKARVRMQNANLSAIGKRIEVGRSLLARERSLLSLGGIGET